MGQRLGLPRIAAVLVCVAIAGLAMVSIGWVVISQLSTLAADLRTNSTYRQHIREKLGDFQRVGKGGVIANLQATAEEVLRSTRTSFLF